jgi:CBS domain-containing protein
MQKIRALVEGRPVYGVTPEMTVLEAARYMSEKRVGAVIVLNEGAPAGIFSERDLMERVVIAGRDPARVPVREVMTRDLLTASPEESPVECMQKMQRRGCRHLPVVEDGKVVGVLSLRDLLKIEIDEKTETIMWMNAYIHDVPPERMT